ncbi:putative mitochondrial protein, partial [Mucuna pruriens]
MRRIHKLYDETKIINELFCFFVDSEPLNFGEPMKKKGGDKQWKKKLKQLRRMTLGSCQAFPWVMKQLKLNEIGKRGFKIKEDNVMSCEFEMINLRIMSYYLGLEVKLMDNDIFVLQESYTKEVLENFRILNCNYVKTPMEGGLKLSKLDKREGRSHTFQDFCLGGGGGLRYLTNTRLNILYIVEVVIKSLHGNSCFYSHESYKDEYELLERSLKELFLLQKNNTNIYIDDQFTHEFAKNLMFHKKSLEKVSTTVGLSKTIEHDRGITRVRKK